MATRDRNHGTGSGRRHKPAAERSRYELATQDGQRILEVIDAITEHSGAIRIGRTRDGGALAIGVYGDGDAPYTDYLRPGESLAGYLEELLDDAFRDITK